MASCTRIDNALQAYVDGELSPSERVIVEQHLGECPPCRKMLKHHQRAAAVLFETFSECRLSNDLTQPVIENLPEMNTYTRFEELSGFNRRAKHPTPVRERVFRSMPFAAAAILVLMAAVLNKNWPAAPLPDDAVGVVTAQDGSARRSAANDDNNRRLRLRDVVALGDTVSTSTGGGLRLALAGGAEVHLAGDTSLRLDELRQLSVERGKVLLRVEKAEEYFQVQTPNGEITVFGTVFQVDVRNNTTTVVVQEGTVAVQHKTNPQLSTLLNSGSLVRLADETLQTRRVARPADYTKWALDLIPDAGAVALFNDRVVPMYEFRRIASGESVIHFEFDEPRSIRSIKLQWENAGRLADRCGYDVWIHYYEEGDMSLLFSGDITPEVLRNRSLSSFEIFNHDNISERVSNLWVKFVPQPGTGRTETQFKSKDVEIITTAG